MEAKEAINVLREALEYYASPAAYPHRSYVAHEALAATAPALQVEAQPASLDLQSIEQYRMQMAGISTAAIGYWKVEDGIHPDYDTLALRDVAALYAKYAELHDAVRPPLAVAAVPHHPICEQRGYNPLCKGCKALAARPAPAVEASEWTMMDAFSIFQDLTQALDAISKGHQDSEEIARLMLKKTDALHYKFLEAARQPVAAVEVGESVDTPELRSLLDAYDQAVEKFHVGEETEHDTVADAWASIIAHIHAWHAALAARQPDAEALLRSIITRPDLSDKAREQFVRDVIGGEEITVCWGDFKTMAAARQSPAAPAEPFGYVLQNDWRSDSWSFFKGGTKEQADRMRSVYPKTHMVYLEPPAAPVGSIELPPLPHGDQTLYAPFQVLAYGQACIDAMKGQTP